MRSYWCAHVVTTIPSTLYLGSHLRTIQAPVIQSSGTCCHQNPNELYLETQFEMIETPGIQTNATYTNKAYTRGRILRTTADNNICMRIDINMYTHTSIHDIIENVWVNESVYEVTHIPQTVLARWKQHWRIEHVMFGCALMHWSVGFATVCVSVWVFRFRCWLIW